VDRKHGLPRGAYASIRRGWLDGEAKPP